MTAPAGLRVVVVGTSLGGLTALPVILRALPRGFRCPVVVVQRPAGDTEDEHGKVVKGRGYVSGRNDSSGSGKASGSSGGSSSGSAGRASSSDSEKKGSSTGRKAKPKPSE